MSDNEGCGTAIVVALVVSLFWVVVIAWPVQDIWQRACIDHGAAHYDPVTAKFVWNEEEQKVKKAQP